MAPTPVKSATLPAIESAPGGRLRADARAGTSAVTRAGTRRASRGKGQITTEPRAEPGAALPLGPAPAVPSPAEPGTPGKPGVRATKRLAKAARRPAAFALDTAAVADVAGLTQEVALLRASIRQLAQDGTAIEHVKVLAELRHQVEALCTALKTQQALDGRDGDTLAADLARALDELGDELGVPR